MPNQLYRNLGNGRFEDVSPRAGQVFELFEVSRGAAFGDIDNDGDADVVIANAAGPARLMVNQVGNRAAWLGLRVVGSTGRDALGARVEITRDGSPTLVRRVRSDGSYASANDPRVLVGLGASAGAPRVRVQWPDGKVEQWSSIPVNTWTTLRQGTGQ
jgi:hypothetical protein